MRETFPSRYVGLSVKLRVWAKAQPIIGQDPFLWGSDGCGGIMRFTAHGDTNSKYGWEIGHIKPVALGGTDDIANLQPLHWENNRWKGLAIRGSANDCS
jgi:hypothetical protein